MSFKYKDLFPFPKIRPQQEKAIEFALDQFLNKDKKFVIIEAETGTGKSPMAITIAKYLNKHLKAKEEYESGGWILTTQKMLQDQYMKDFGVPRGSLRTIKSSSNYGCEFFKKNRCSDSLHLLKEADPDSKFYKKCYYSCNYKIQKRAFIDSDLGITNFPYFLTETSYIQKIVPKKCLVIDEAHNIEEELGKHIEVVISEKFAFAILDLEMPEIKNQQQAVDWVKEEYAPALDEKFLEISQELKIVQEKGEDDTDEARRIASNKEKIAKHKSKVEKFIHLYSKSNWVFNLIPSWNKSGRKLEFKSIDVGEYANESLFKFGQKVLLLSATILNKEAFCESIGIKSKDAAFISIESPFPKENMPVFYVPAGDLSKAKIDETLPNLANIVEAIMDEHKGEKGIIHTRTFKIANYLQTKIKSKRILIHDSTNKQEILEKYMKSKKDTVLLSPSSTEGLDLKGDLSRFQIVCKLHWPFLGDDLVKKRMNKYDYWYAYQAVKSLVQARGRSIRNADDYAVTYILDNAFERLFAKNINLFPKSFKDCLHMD